MTPLAVLEVHLGRTSKLASPYLCFLSSRWGGARWELHSESYQSKIPPCSFKETIICILLIISFKTLSKKCYAAKSQKKWWQFFRNVFHGRWDAAFNLISWLFSISQSTGLTGTDFSQDVSFKLNWKYKFRCSAMDKDLASNPICAWKKPLRCPGTESALSANVQSNSNQMPVTR